MAMMYDQVAVRLDQVVPEFTLVFRRHHRLYGERQNHLLLNELLHFITQLHDSAAGIKGQYPDAGDILRRIFEFVEEASASADDRVTELVYSSLLKPLAVLGPEYSDLLILLGPNSRKLAL